MLGAIRCLQTVVGFHATNMYRLYQVNVTRPKPCDGSRWSRGSPTVTHIRKVSINEDARMGAWMEK